MDDVKHALKTAGLKSPEMREYTFRLRGHDQDIPAVSVVAESEEKAFTKALKSCKRFELPGWRLCCVETGSAVPVVKLTGFAGASTLEPAYKDKGRRISKRV